jgi:integrase/recombinase XerD
MAQAKVITEQELKRALGMVTGRKHAARDRLALLLTHWADIRVCEVAALIRDTVLGSAGEILEEWRLGSDQTKGSMGRVVYANSKLRKEVAA